MRFLVASLIAASLAAAFIGNAHAEILIMIDKSAQRMTVERDGEPLYTWPVSTGRTGYATPTGSYTAFRMEANHYSKEWDDAPMPHSIFFTKIGHAIHGSYESKKLGMPASHGCVRLSPANAAILFALVEQNGVTNTKVVLTGSGQVALARRGVREPRLQRPLNINPNAGYESEYVQQYVNPSAGYPQPDNAQPHYVYQNGAYWPKDYAQPRYVNPNYGFAQQPQYVRLQNRRTVYAPCAVLMLRINKLAPEVHRSVFTSFIASPLYVQRNAQSSACKFALGSTQG
jgi:hypothetical protein